MPTGIFTRKGSARSARVKHRRKLWTAGRKPAHPLDFSGPSCPSALLHKSFIKCPLLDRACRWNRAVRWYAREWFLGHGPSVSSSVGAGGVPACSVSGSTLFTGASKQSRCPQGVRFSEKAHKTRDNLLNCHPPTSYLAEGMCDCWH